MKSKRALIYGKNWDLIRIRAHVLEYASFDVTCVDRLASIEGLSPERDVDLVVLCHSLTPADRREGFLTCRRIWPEIKVITMIGFTEEDREVLGESMRIAEGPEALVALSRKLTEVSGSVAGMSKS